MTTGDKLIPISTVIKKLISSTLDGVHVSIPGVVVNYDSSEITATVRPAINTRFCDDVLIAAPLIYNVPVVFPRSSKASITFPLEKDDEVLLIFSETSLDEWLDKGKNSNPPDTRRFDLSDAIAIPGCFHKASGKRPTDGSKLEIQYKDQSISIKSNGDIDIGSGTLEKLVTQAFMATYNSHTHIVPNGTSNAPLPLMSTSHLTSKVSAE